MHDDSLLYRNKEQPRVGIDADILSERIPVLDGFRGIAVLLVMGYHYIPSFFFGWVGVDLFFVLSGFLITSILIQNRRNKSYLGVYFSRRFLRIIPVYFLALLFLFILLPVVAPAIITYSYGELIQHQEWYWLFAINIFYALHGFPDNITTVHFWSLACEMQFYIIWPLILAIFRDNFKQILIALLTLIILSMVFRVVGEKLFQLNEIYRYVLLPSRLDAFCAGALLYMSVISKPVFTRRLSYFLATSVVLVAVVLAFFNVRWHFTYSFVQKFGLSLNAVFWFSILFLAIKFQKSFPGQVGNNRILRNVGIYSYGMYIFHLPVGIFMSKLPYFSSEPEQGILMLTVKTIVSFLITVFISMISYHLFEKQVMLLKPRYDAAKI